MISVEEALAHVAAHATPLPAVRLPLNEVLGLQLAEEVVSNADSPPFDKSMVDGFAVAQRDDSRERQVIEQVIAGDVPRHAVVPGAAIRVMTGAPVPDGTDAVIKQEDVEWMGEQTIRLPSLEITKGAGILVRGSSFTVGEGLLAPGRRLGPIEIALLAELGKARAEVVPRPRVAVLATGNELVPAGKKTAPGQITNSNSPMLLASVAEVGAEGWDLGICRDDANQLRSTIRRGLEADVLLITGGVSVGVMDLVPGVLTELGVQEIFHKVRVKPGKPVWFGVLEQREQRTLVFGLPGNPVSAWVGFELLVKPALRALAGAEFAPAQSQHGVLSNSVSHRGKRPSYQPCRVSPASSVNELPQVEAYPWRGSADLAALSRANALAVLASGDYTLEAGEKVLYLTMGP